MSSDYTVCCYYFPNYHVDPRNEKVHGKGWSEWELVKRGEPRLTGHQQPKVPFWGYTDESDPAQMAQKIAAAADHAVDVFLYDWYYYDDGPFIERGLEKGFLGAPNNSRMKFALMWANHDWYNIHPAKLRERNNLLYPGRIKPETFKVITAHCINTYFKHPSYWLIEGRPYFSVYDLQKMIESFGSVEATREAFEAFRSDCRRAGLPGLHINCVLWGQTILPGEKIPANPVELVRKLGFDSFTSYVWVHHGGLSKVPFSDYDACRDNYFAYWDRIVKEIPLPYYPNVTMGWDPSARVVQSEMYDFSGYPCTPILTGNTPERFKEALRLTRERLDASVRGPKIMSINAWNEWTEGSYLEPDMINGMSYLEAIKAVFG
ncbi:MAG TPA: glycoside hydrolase family 99-like domain-containing protein [Candidatus Brocadiia bacterium]|nr:glycoside hydrolase family 99-like domain-containing protein [Candidatus Brocadiia bacterium]